MSDSEGEDFYEGTDYYGEYDNDDELRNYVSSSIKSETSSKSIQSEISKKTFF